MLRIKCISTPNFEISFYETRKGYKIETKLLGKTLVSEEIKDFSIASMLFSAKLQELEGH